MSEIAAPLVAQQTARRSLSLELRLTWEAAAYACVVIIGVGMRFWDLGSRALHHDESLHGFYAYEIFQGNGYTHDPLLHGPFQFFGTALTFFLTGGASDYTVRIFPALFGVALILLPLLFRDRLGRLGALFASALIAFSPTLLYFSRFARNDIYVAVFTLGIVIALWRYVYERKPIYLYACAGLLGLSFATKENTFINVAVLLVFLNLWLAADLARQSQRRIGDPASAYPFYVVAYLPCAWALAALWPLIGGIRRTLGLRQRHPAADFLVVLGTLSLPQFAAAVRVPLESLGFELDTLARERWVGWPTVLILLAATALVGLRWNWRVWPLAAAAFYVPYALLFTSFGTNADGFGTGIWESLDYWLAQHDFRRGDQPDFYYVMLLPAYEFLALAIAGPALLYFTLRGGPRSWLLTGIATLSLLAFFGADSFSASVGAIAAPVALPVAAVSVYFAVRGSPFERFLVFWTAAAIVGYSWVGEKMPWLSVHTTLPVVILAAYSLGRLLTTGPGEVGARLAPYLRPLTASTFAALAVGLGVFAPHDGTAGLLRLAGIALALAAIVAVLMPPGRRRLTTITAFAVFGGLALFSARTAVVASFQHGDVPREMLVYTQTSPDVPDVMERIEETGRISGLGRDLPVVVDKTYTWPWAWYLREYNLDYDDMGDDFSPPEDAVLLVARENEGSLTPFLNRYQEPEPYRLRAWFPEVPYRGIGRDNLWLAIRDFGRSLVRSDTWDNWWRFFRDREPPSDLGSVNASAYFPLMYDPDARPDVEGRLIIGEAGEEPGALSEPSAVAVDGEGNVYVADPGNARIQKFAPDGGFLAETGSEGGGEGQFNDPGDLAVDAQGNVYVIDTWNHRVQKFDSDLNFIAAWGEQATSLLDPGDYGMWGPRSITVDSDDNVWVVDTGTSRVRKFTPKGEGLATLGEQGRELGQFREPVGIAFDTTTGDILVADAGNGRIQRFDAQLQPVAAYPIEEWQDQDPANKPDLAALPDGRLLASDPAHGRVLLLDEDGTVVAALSSVGEVALAFPRGIAYEPDGRFVFVSELTANRVRRFPLNDFAFR